VQVEPTTSAAPVTATPEIHERPLTDEALAARFRALCADSALTKVPGKLELDQWGRILMTPASNYHGMMQSRFANALAALAGTAMVETSVLTAIGVLVADVAWGSAEFVRLHEYETPYSTAPDLCVEIASPSNSMQALQEKVAAYLGAGAREVWLVFPQAKRIEMYDLHGTRASSAFVIDSATLFD
jgi:Uma2 family endonuclease